MGAMIRLALGNFEVDWGGHPFFINHLPLYQPGDLTEMLVEYIEDRTGLSKLMPAKVLSKPLKDIAVRLRLLGYSLSSAASDFKALQVEFGGSKELSFERLLEAIKKLDVSKVSREYSHDPYGKFFYYEIEPRLNLKEYLPSREEQADLSEMMENSNPWSTLCMLAERRENLDVSLVWDFSEIIESGLEADEAFMPHLEQAMRFLIVTEGSSDAAILRKALDLLRPAIADFFYFVDMEAGYPFTGTGNLGNFCKGLASIGILNKTLVVFDNDAEGVFKAGQVKSLNLPSNLGVFTLPDIKELRAVPTVGPGGRSVEDINGRAASIEAYLDLNWNCDRPPLIRWTSFIEKLGQYQGSLETKEAYFKRFLNLRAKEPGYDFSKIEAVLDRMVDACAAIAAANPASPP